MTINFAAGPSTLPASLMPIISKDMLNYKDSGIGILSMSHRNPLFIEMVTTCNQNIRKVMNISNEYEILWMQGGGTAQFSAVALNLIGTGKGNYIVSGSWSKKAMQEAERYLYV